VRVIHQLAKQVMDRERSALEEAAYTLVVCGKDSRAFVGEELQRNKGLHKGRFRETEKRGVAGFGDSEVDILASSPLPAACQRPLTC
jgi:hypothetical protein